jgi:hypothetical protein
MMINPTIDVELMNNKRKRRPPTAAIASQKNNVVKTDSFFFQNELKVSEVVRKIRYHRIWFDIIQKHTPMKIKELDDRTKYQHEISYEERDAYFLCEYPTIRRFGLLDFLSNLPSDKLVVFHLFDSFSLLLNSIDLLSRNGLAFFCVSPQDIVIGEHLRPVIRNFENCCFLDQASQFIANHKESEYNPIECRAACYLTENKCASLSIANIEEICDGCSSEYVDYLRKFINKPAANIIHELLSSAGSWSKYSLALVYLHLIDELSTSFSLKYKFMDEFINLLHQISDPNPYRLVDTLEIQTRLRGINDFTSFY